MPENLEGQGSWPTGSLLAFHGIRAGVSFGGHIFSVPLQDVHACSRARSPLLTCLGNLYQLKREFSRNLSEEAEHEKCRYTEEQIIGILKQHEAGVKTAYLCREHGVSAATVYNWEQKVGGMEG